ncbi:hypothetical protein B0H11DRAFT_2078088 [Mycena galericulata]|nr:hypothetical protein B0H11DRAFT_2078088 [Mycena galericulata]
MEPQTELQAKGATGDTGEAPNFLTLLISDGISEKIQMPTLSIDEFCTQYGLEGEIGEILSETGYERASDLLFTKEKFAFKVGHTAELKWALKHMLWSRAVDKDVPKKEEHKTDVDGGRGGVGGFGRIGGVGGEGKAPVIRLSQSHGFNIISGGRGGAGGSGTLVASSEDSKRKDQDQIQDMPPNRGEFINAFGGTGRSGASHNQVGGDGGAGKAPVIPIEDVGKFRKIEGGYGGPGGNSVNVGGRGGTGHAPEFPELLAPIDKETRLRVKNVKLSDSEKLRQSKFEISPELNQLLRDDGFLTVGGLLETYDTDLDREPFKPEHKSTLTQALTEFLREMKRVESSS